MPTDANPVTKNLIKNVGAVPHMLTASPAAELFCIPAGSKWRIERWRATNTSRGPLNNLTGADGYLAICVDALADANTIGAFGAFIMPGATIGDDIGIVIDATNGPRKLWACATTAAKIVLTFSTTDITGN